MLVPFVACRGVVAIHGRGVEVERYRVDAVLGGHPAEPADVRAQVPHRARRRALDPRGDDLLLPPAGGLGVVGRLGLVVGPRADGLGRAEALDPLAQAVEQSPERLEAEAAAGGRRRSFGSCRPVGRVAALALRVQEQVQLQRRPRLRPPRQQRGGEVERHPVDVLAQHESQAHVAVGHQRERRQEVLTELPVGDPRRPLGQAFERQGVDQHGTAAMELDVVRAGVAERHAVVHRRRLEPEREQRGVPELREAPFVGVGDERDDLGTEHAGGAALGREGRVLLVRDQKTGVVQRGPQTRGLEQVVVRGGGRVDVAVQDAVAAEQVAARIAERTGNGVGHRTRHAVRRARRARSRDA